MKIYLAGPCDTDHRTVMVSIAQGLRNLKYDVYCPWELKIENAWDYPQEEWAQKVFDADIAAINDADSIVMISVGRNSTAGTNWEQGYAYALGKPVYVIQITEANTSLMTFCGCTRFINGNKGLHAALCTLQMYLTDQPLFKDDKKVCKTVLT